MEYCPTLLENEIKANKTEGIYFDPMHALSFSLQIIRGLSYIHSVGIVHRDLKVILCCIKFW